MKSIDRVNFIPFAEGVPNVSVNDIVFLRDKNLSLLLATDAGVYYRNENMNAWQIFADSLPHVPIKDIEINDAKNLAIVGTMGRGVWQAPLPCSSKDNVLKIDLNETWNNGKRIDGDIIIQKARVLTINSNVSISNGVKIVLEHFAKLVINKGGKITNNENWGDAWEGNINAEENASIIFHEGSSIRLKGKGGMLIKSGTMPASLIFNSKAEFFLSDEETFIKVKGKMQSLDGGKIPVFGKGKVL